MGSLWRSLLVTAILVTGLIAAAGAVAAQEGPVTLQVVGGLGGRAREAVWAPVLVTVSNHGKLDLRGNLLAHMPGSMPSQIARTRYQVELLLPAGSQKTISLPVFFTLAFSPYVTFESDGAILARAPVAVTILSQEIVLAGILSDEPGAFQSISGARVPGRQRVEAIPLTAASLPDDPLLLETLDLIVVGRFDTTKLTAKQRQALEAWVSGGGILVIAAGPEGRSTLSGLPESLLPVTATGSTRIASAELATFGGFPLADTVPITVGALRMGAPLVGTADQPLVAVAGMGAGQVAYLAFDVSLDPIHTWGGLTNLWEQLLGPLVLLEEPSATRLLGSGFPTTGITGALKRMPTFGLPQPRSLVVLLLLYGLVIGPGLYALLSRFDKREWSWAGVPLVAVLSLGSLYLVGFRSRDAGMNHTVTLTQVLPDATALIRTYSAVFTPSQEAVRVTLPEGVLASGLILGDSMPDFDRAYTEVAYGQETTLNLLDPTRWELRGFQAVSRSQFSGTLTFVTTGWDGTRLTGTVMNGLGVTLRDAALVTALGVHLLGDLSDGESVNVALPLAQAGGSSPLTHFGRIFSTDPAEMRRRDAAIHLFTQMRNGASPLQLTLLGWTEEPPADTPTVRGIGRPLQTTNMIYTRITPNLRLTGREIPPGVIVGHLTNSYLGQPPVVTDQGMQAAPGIYWFEFELPPLDRTAIDTISLHFGAPGQAIAELPFEVQIYNWKTRQWLALPAVPEQALGAWADFVSPSGLVSMRLDLPATANIPLLSLSVRGVVHQ